MPRRLQRVHINTQKPNYLPGYGLQNDKGIVLDAWKRKRKKTDLHPGSKNKRDKIAGYILNRSTLPKQWRDFYSCSRLTMLKEGTSQIQNLSKISDRHLLIFILARSIACIAASEGVLMWGERI